jgi:hypothetical protein
LPNPLIPPFHRITQTPYRTFVFTMGGYRRHNSPTGVEPGSPKVGFAGVTGISRPNTNEEHWTLYYFEAHAAQCEACQDPLRVSKAGRQLCRTGHELAVDVADLFIYHRKDDKVYSRVKEGEKEVRVEIPHDYEQTLSLLKAINRAVRKGEKSPTKPFSHDKNYFVDSRVSPEKRDLIEEVQQQPLSMRRPYETKLIEPKSPRPAPKPRRRERESTDDLIADSKRGSLYGEDLARLERAEKRDQQLRYNIEFREPTLRTPRRQHTIYP